MNCIIPIKNPSQEEIRKIKSVTLTWPSKEEVPRESAMSVFTRPLRSFIAGLQSAVWSAHQLVASLLSQSAQKWVLLISQTSAWRWTPSLRTNTSNHRRKLLLSCKKDSMTLSIKSSACFTIMDLLRKPSLISSWTVSVISRPTLRYLMS